MTAPAALRRGLIVLAASSTVGTAYELATERHWKSGIQLVPWFTVAVIAGALVLVVARPRCGTIRLVRVLMLAVALAAAFGVYEHVRANYEAAPLDFRYSERWATMSTTARWWTAATKSVGPSPPLAPAILAQAAFCLALATVDHPALAAGTDAGPHVAPVSPERRPAASPALEGSPEARS